MLLDPGRMRSLIDGVCIRLLHQASPPPSSNVRQGLHTLLHTQGLDGLLHLYKRLEKWGRVLLLCLLCAEAGWLILVNAWLRLERAYLKLRLFLRV
jgi:hypothetical protein